LTAPTAKTCGLLGVNAPSIAAPMPELGAQGHYNIKKGGVKRTPFI